MGEPITASDGQRLEDTAAYLVRNSLSLKKLVYLDGQRAVLYHSRMNPALGRNVMQGRPVIRGTRVTVHLLVRKLSEGATEGDLLDAYPHLTAEDIRGALAYAADTVSHEEIVLTARPPKTAARS